MRRRFRQTNPPAGPFGVNAESPQAQGLAAWVPALASRAAAVGRELVAGRNLAHANSPSWANHAEAGPMLSLAGGSSQRATSAAMPLTAYPLTLAVWVTTTSAAADETAFYLGNNGDDTTFCRIGVLASTGKPFAHVIGSTVNLLVFGASAVATNTLYHLAATMAAANSLKFYVNGVLAGSDTSGTSNASTPNVWGVGALVRATPIQHWSGLIGDARLYARALSDAEVWGLYDPRTRWDLYRPLRRRAQVRPGASFSVSPATLLPGSTGNAVTLTGLFTNWTAGTPGSPTFGIGTTGSGASITAQTVGGAASATLTIDAGTAGTITLTDPGTGATATIGVSSGSVRDREWPRGVARGLLAA